MIDSNSLPTFNDAGLPTHWIAPAPDHKGFRSIDNKDRYTQQAVKENRNKPLNEYETESKGKSIKRHYIQDSAVVKDKVKTLIDRLDIPTHSEWLLFAGFTGELADVLSTDLGGSVLFTDPLETWVKQAAKRGFETDQCRIQTCPGEYFDCVDGVATFEGYEAISKDVDLLYDGMRCLTTRHGLTFFQSEFTRSCTQVLGNGTSIKGRLKAFEKAYDVTACYRENKGLRAYHMSANSQKTRAKILADYLTIYLTVDLHFSDANEITTNNGTIQVTQDLLSTISYQLQIPYQQAKNAYNRIETVEYNMKSQVEQTYAERHRLGFPMRNQVVMIAKNPQT